jgi:hypothetical protein
MMAGVAPGLFLLDAPLIYWVDYPCPGVRSMHRAGLLVIHSVLQHMLTFEELGKPLRAAKDARVVVRHAALEADPMVLALLDYAMIHA